MFEGTKRVSIQLGTGQPSKPQLGAFGLLRMLLLAAGLCELMPPAQAQPVPGTATSVRSAAGTLLDYQPLPNAPEGAAAYRVLYRSTGLRGESIAVSGAIIVPAGTVPPGDRPIVA